ncbi:glycerol dehydrogenase [Fusibacter paucivorans]|uniref:Glycerol dehydrogenase n=1 Tax=Fusibacter paucivorans TaxID=76009 RepID=A0ABS5PR46_9FIRM|nr:glycerol dehydrogenase [Fusibacter paucivorans]MBS7527635.1 glycerol dehydrogenase [Fusibacter paucivorans]
MIKTIIAPGKYVQGEQLLASISDYTKEFGSKLLFIASANGIKRTEQTIENSYKALDVTLGFEAFNGECCDKEINRIKTIIENEKYTAIIGIGGGKIFDTVKAVAYEAAIPVGIVPTIASTDAPCSALSVIYTESGVFDRYLVLPSNPELVLVDTTIIANAPSRLLVAGMGDALATYFEARACERSCAPNMTGTQSTLSANALAKLCYETLLKDGFMAKCSVDKKVCTKALENIIEANTLLSGIGFESGGLAAAHAIHNGFTVMEACHHLYHGEKVAFGTIVQLVLEHADADEINTVIAFCKKVGLPVTLKAMGVENIVESEIRAVAEAACAEGETIYNMPFCVTADMVYSAIMLADALGNA